MAITNAEWTLDQKMINNKCLCFQSNYMVQVNIKVNKQMFFPNEKIRVLFSVDNTKNKRDIKDVQCTLTYNVKIKKG